MPSVLASGVTIPGWLAVFAATLAVVTTVAAGWAVARSAAVKESLTTIIDANEELRHANADLRDELTQEKERRAQLEGRLDVLMSGLAERIIAAVVDTWHRSQAAAGRSNTGGT